MRLFSIGLFLAFFACGAMAADLFVDGAVRPMKLGDKIEATDTIGGFSFYLGDGNFKFEKANGYQSTGGTGPIPMGSLAMTEFLGGKLFLGQRISSTLGTGGGTGWSGTPCSPAHLVRIDKGRGREDHCLTIDPVSVNVGNQPTTMLSVKVTNSAGGRYVFSNLEINPDLLGIRNTGVGDWTEEAISAQPYKAQFMDRLKAWSEKLLIASIRAFDYSQPSDAYKDVPSVRTLLPAIDGFPADKFSLSFLSALEDFKRRPEPKALAYTLTSPTSTPHGWSWGVASQELANKTALEGCEKWRKPEAPACVLVDLSKIMTAK